MNNIKILIIILFSIIIYLSSFSVKAYDSLNNSNNELTEINYQLSLILIEIKRQNLILCSEKVKTGDKQMIKICEHVLINNGEV